MPKGTQAIALYTPRTDEAFKSDPCGWDPFRGAGGERGEKPKDDEVRLYSDSDWAGCRVTRRSSSGGVLLYRGCLVAAWSRRQGSVCLSSAEAELGALTAGIVEAMFVWNFLEEVLGDQDGGEGLHGLHGGQSHRHEDGDFAEPEALEH